MNEYPSLGKLSEFLPDIPGAQAFLNAIDDLDLSILEHVHIMDLVVSEDYSGTPFIQFAAAIEGETRLPLPVLDFISLHLGASIPGFTFLRADLFLGQNGYLRIYDFSLALEIEQPYLRLYDLETEQILADRFRFELDAALTINREIDLQFELYNFNIPPFSIGNTGLIMALEGCQLDMGGQSTFAEGSPLLDYGEFSGIYAESAILYWLPQFQTPFASHPGIRIEFNSVVLDKAGVSFDFQQEWDVKHENGLLLPETELIGTLFGDLFRIAPARANGRVIDNIPQSMVVSGFIELPFPQTILSAEFTLETDLEGESFFTEFTLTNASDQDIIIPLGGDTYQLSIHNLMLSGELSDEGFHIEGLAGFSLQLPGFDISVSETNMSFTHSKDEDNFTFLLEDVQFGPLGTVEQATLRLNAVRTADGSTELSEVFMEVMLSWQDIESRLSLDNLPDMFPLPPDDAEISALLSWESDKLTLKFAADVTGVDNLWRFIPEASRPEIRRAQFAFSAVYDTADDFHNSTSNPDNAITGSGDDSSVQIATELSLRLPDLPDFPGSELLHIDTGDEEGWITCMLQASIENGEPHLSVEIANPVSLDIDFPGLPQSQPAVHTTIDSINFMLDSGGDGTSGSLNMAGEFALRPIDPPADLPFSSHLKQLLSGIELSELIGTASVSLQFAQDRVAMILEAQYENAAIEVDIFEMVANLASGLSVPAGIEEPSGSVDLELDIGFGLKGVKLELGSLDDAEPNAPDFLVEVVAGAHIGDVSADGFIRLTDRELTLGLVDAAIPLRIPRFPLAPDDLESLRQVPGNDDSLWDITKWEGDQRITDLEGSEDPEDHKELSRLKAQKFLLTEIFGIHGLLSGHEQKLTYQSGVELVVGALNDASGVLHVDTNARLCLKDFGFKIPFTDPRGISVKGSACLDGFSQDDPLYPLNQTTLTLGLSADQIYFSLDSAGEPIPLPDFGRYHDGSISLTKFTIGYGYTKNSFAMAFAGELILPPQLIEDADTSDEIGAGIRLPHYTNLAFKLDIIPIPGPIPAVPMFEFNLDMREPSSRSLVDSRSCMPYWDGLQLVVPDIIQFDLKQVSFSPLLSFLPCPNTRLDADIMLGDEHTGITIIADNMLYLAGVGMPSPVPIPFLASPNEPYFDNYCVNVRLASFGINFNLQRPFPSFNPLALFEVIGLISDPMLEIDPRGALANCLRISLTDAQITLPPYIKRMFPESEEITRKPVNITINLGTFISVVQAVTRTINIALDAIKDGGRNIERSIEYIQEDPARLKLDELMPTVLSALPPELRKLRVSGSFAGFDARVVLLFMDVKDLAGIKDELTRRGTPAQVSETHGLQVGSEADSATLAHYRPHLNPSGFDGRTYYPDDPENNLFNGIEFEAFVPDDIDDLASALVDIDAKSGVVVGAHVKIFAGQRYRFLGAIFDDGSFGMISSVDIEPLQMSVAGIPMELLLELNGRLKLFGRARRDGGYGAVQAQGWSSWNVIPGILRLKIASADQLATVTIRSDGMFSLEADAELVLGNGAATIKILASISNTHCYVESVAGGALDGLRYKAGEIGSYSLIDFYLACHGRIGPGRSFDIGGEGSLNLFGNPFTKVYGRLTEKGAAIEASLATDEFRIGGWLLKPGDFSLEMAVKGEVNLQKTTRPCCSLEGKGQMQLFGARIRGRGGIKVGVQKLPQNQPGFPFHGDLTKNASESELTAFVEGALFWQGREWLGGRIEIGGTRNNEYVRISGRTSFAVNLTPDNFPLPHNINLAHLALQVNVDGSFKLSRNSGLTGCDLNVEWILGIQSADGGHTFPIAMQKLQIESPGKLIGDKGEKLVHIGGFFPTELFNDLMKNIKFPEPSLEFNELTFVKLQFLVAGSVVPKDFAKDFGWHDFIVDGEDFNIPMNPRLTLKWKSIEPSSLSVTVYLSWQNGKLGLCVKHDGESNFKSFEELIQLDSV